LVGAGVRVDVFVGGTAVLVGGTGVLVFVGGTGVLVFVGGMAVLVGGIGVSVGGSGVFVSVGMAVGTSVGGSSAADGRDEITNTSEMINISVVAEVIIKRGIFFLGNVIPSKRRERISASDLFITCLVTQE